MGSARDIVGTLPNTVAQDNGFVDIPVNVGSSIQWPPSDVKLGVSWQCCSDRRWALNHSLYAGFNFVSGKP